MKSGQSITPLVLTQRNLTMSKEPDERWKSSQTSDKENRNSPDHALECFLKPKVNRTQISLIINAARPLPEEGNEVCDHSNWHRALERPLRQQLYQKLYTAGPGCGRQHRRFPHPQTPARSGSLRDGVSRSPGARGPRLGLLAPAPCAVGRPGGD